MYKLAGLFLFCFCCVQAAAQTLIPYLKSNGKYVYVDSATMKPVINREFDEAFEFSEGCARVQANKKFGYIDKTGKEIISFKYDDASEFSGGFAQVMLNDKYSFIDKTGKEIIPFIYSFIGRFTNGMAWARLDDKSGYIDETGKEIIPIKFAGLSDFYDGLARIEINGKFGYINKKGELVIPAKYDEAFDYSQGVAAVQINRKYGYIDTKGKEIIPLKYHFASPASGELLQVTVVNDKGGYLRGYINRSGQPVTPINYEKIDEISRDIFLAKTGNKILLMNKKLVQLVAWDQYDYWKLAGEGIAVLQIKKGMPDAGKYVMINKDGKEITTDKFEYVGEYNNGIAAYKSNGRWGYINKTGKKITEAKYDDLKSFKNGLSLVKQKNRWFTIDLAGREYLEMEKPLASGWLFFDDFTDNRNKWVIDSTSSDFRTIILSNDYLLQNKRTDQSRYLLRKIPGWNEKNNFRIEITMQYAFGTPENIGNGLIIGCDEKISNYYRMMYNPGGSYRIDQAVSGKIAPLLDWNESNQLKKDGHNKLGFTQINGQWAFYINDKKVYEMKAKEFVGNGIGVFIGPSSSYYWESFGVYDWTAAATYPELPKEPLYDAQTLDYFTNNRLEWGTADNQDVTATFTNDAYRIKNKTDGYYMSYQLFAEADMKAHRVELDLRHIDGVNDYAFGLCFGQKDLENSWLFVISATGNFQIGKFENGKWIVIKDWTESEAILKGNNYTNRLRYENDKGKWNFYINDKLVYTRNASVLAGRRFGCYVEDKQTVEFTRFIFSRIIYPNL